MPLYQIVLSSKGNKLQESEDERRATQDDKLLAHFLMGTIFLIYILYQSLQCIIPP